MKCDRFLVSGLSGGISCWGNPVTIEKRIAFPGCELKGTKEKLSVKETMTFLGLVAEVGA